MLAIALSDFNQTLSMTNHLHVSWSMQSVVLVHRFHEEHDVQGSMFLGSWRIEFLAILKTFSGCIGETLG